MKRCIRIKNTIVTSCDTCPRNVEIVNKFNVEIMNKLWSILPPTHHCKDAFDGSTMDGRVIVVRNIIPAWCPYDIEDYDAITFDPME